MELIAIILASYIALIFLDVLLAQKRKYSRFHAIGTQGSGLLAAIGPFTSVGNNISDLLDEFEVSFNALKLRHRLSQPSVASDKILDQLDGLHKISGVTDSELYQQALNSVAS